jgi:N-carbamoylputrescine amidase
LRVTVCELSNDPAQLEGQWKALVGHVKKNVSELLLLPELPFYPWLPGTPEVDPAEWARSIAAHEDWLGRIPELGVPTLVATRPTIDGDRRFNEVLVWERSRVIPAHRKHYLPDEAGFWEASWYSRGEGEFSSVDVRGARLGFMVCTEQWFLVHAREYAKRGVQVLACPRATLAPSVGKWLAGGRTAAVVSGAFCLSSNFSGSAGEHGKWGGVGWIVEPEEGEVLGTTSPEKPFLTLDIDLVVADRAKSTYPRYVIE